MRLSRCRCCAAYAVIPLQNLMICDRVKTTMREEQDADAIIGCEATAMSAAIEGKSGVPASSDDELSWKRGK